MPELILRPQQGYQDRIASCNADISVGGGAAGAGKSWSAVFEAVRHIGVAGFSAIIFRRTYPELIGAGSVWEESAKYYPLLGGIPLESRLEWRFPSGATVKFSHMQYEKDKLQHQGKQYALIIFEEVCHFTSGQFWYLVGSRNRTTCGVTPYVRCTCNPDPDSFIAKMIEWWIDEDGFPDPGRAGVVRCFVRRDDVLVWRETKQELIDEFACHWTEPRSFTFIPGKLDDNKILLEADPGYQGRLDSLPRVDRSRLKLGNWKVRPTYGEFYRGSDFRIVDAIPADIYDTVRVWDKAATEPSPRNPDPDWTVGTLMSKLVDGRYIVEHMERFRGRPATVDRRMTNIAAQDGEDVRIGVFQDPGQAGKVDVAHMKRLLDGYTVTSSRPNQAGKQTAAGPFSSQVEAGNVLLLQGGWNEPFIAEHESFSDGKHDDIVDTTSECHRLLQENRGISYA